MKTTAEARARTHKYYLEHQDKYLEYARRYYQENKKRITDRNNEYRRLHPEKHRAYNHKRYIRQRKALLEYQQKYYDQNIRPFKAEYKQRANGYELFKDGVLVKEFFVLKEVEKFLGYSKGTITVYMNKNKELLGFIIKRKYLDLGVNENDKN